MLHYQGYTTLIARNVPVTSSRHLGDVSALSPERVKCPPPWNVLMGPEGVYVIFIVNNNNNGKSPSGPRWTFLERSNAMFQGGGHFTRPGDVAGQYSRFLRGVPGTFRTIRAHYTHISVIFYPKNDWHFMCKHQLYFT